jgi:CRISPR-associated protein Cas2
MRGVADYAVAYDITSDRERRRVEKVVKSFGFRVQKSVFECRMRRRDREELLARLEKLGLKTGFVKVYRLTSGAKNPVVGKAPERGLDDAAAFIV